MIFRRFISFLLCIVITLSFCIQCIFAEEGSENSNNNSSTSSSSIVIDNSTNYYNYYYINYPKYDNVSLYSLNNQDSEAYWRPKYNDISIALKDYIEWNGSTIKVDKNAFDVEWSEVNKERFPTSRALEILGYDFLLFEETVDKNSGVPKRTIGYNNYITAPYFIMNIYKALGIELYDIYYVFDEDKATCGVYVTRTDPDSYWKLFLNDHPIDYDVYNDSDILNYSTGSALTGADAISILAEMLDFYGEPVISKQEEYMLLQAYGDDVPTALNDSQRLAWSYLKCRGIIGEDEISYNDAMSFDTMMDLLMRTKDKDSRTNFKEVQITTNLDSVFINNGYYESEATLAYAPEIYPEDVSISWTSADRIDYLIAVSDSTAFKYRDTGELNRNIFISYGPDYNSSAIPGSIYHGIVDGKYYHFSIPRSQVVRGHMYINSKSDGDMPLNYYLPSGNGGVYTSYSIKDGSLYYEDPRPFSEVMPDSFYADMDRVFDKSGDVALAAGSGTITATFDTTMLNVDASIKTIESLGGIAKLNAEKTRLFVYIDASKVQGISSESSRTYEVGKFIGRRLTLKSEYVSKSEKTNIILGLTGDGLLVPLDKLMDIGAVSNYTTITEKGKAILIIYMNDKDIIRVDDKNNTIQRGNTYIQLNSDTPLFRYTKGKNGKSTYEVDFRAIYGTSGVGFSIERGGSNDATVYMYNSSINPIYSGNDTTFGVSNRVGPYYYYDTVSYLAYDGTQDSIVNSNVPVLYRYKDNASIGQSSKDSISTALLPFSSPNVFGNYILYSEWNVTKSIVDTYLVVFNPKDGGTPATADKTYDQMFHFIPNAEALKSYDVNVYKVTADNALGIIDVPGVGYCYTLNILDNGNKSRTDFMSQYIAKKKPIPFAVDFSGSTPRLLNFNHNFYSADHYRKLVRPANKGFSVNGAIPAAVSLQSWFSDSSTVATLSASSAKTQSSTGPYLFWGTSTVKANSKGKLIAQPGSLELSYADSDIHVFGMSKSKNKAANSDTGKVLWKNPGMYYINSTDFTTTISNAKEDTTKSDIDIKAARLQEFFDKFDDITFMDFINGLDSTMSIVYYIITRVIPLIILCLLVIMLIISMVSDIKLVQLFCDKVFDPVKILTFGNYNIHTMNNRFLIFSLIGALTIMGIIQAGNLEKIIMFFIRFYYAIMMFFE